MEKSAKKQKKTRKKERASAEGRKGESPTNALNLFCLVIKFPFVLSLSLNTISKLESYFNGE